MPAFEVGRLHFENRNKIWDKNRDFWIVIVSVCVNIFTLFNIWGTNINWKNILIYKQKKVVIFSKTFPVYWKWEWQPDAVREAKVLLMGKYPFL